MFDIDPIQLAAALLDLGITPEKLTAVQTADPIVGPKRLLQLKLEAKQRYRRLAFELHPDRNENDPVKSRRFSFLGEVLRLVETMEYKVLPPPIVVRQVRFAVPLTVPNSRPRRSMRDPRGVYVVNLKPR